MDTSGKMQLLQKFYRGIITDEELRSLFLWLNSEKGNQEYEMLSNKKWLSSEFKSIEDIDSFTLFSKIENRMRKKQLSGRRQLLIRSRNAAAIFIIGMILPFAYTMVINHSEKGKEVQYIEQSLSNEKVKKMILPDGTDVWLMSGSTLRYPSDFSGKKTRNVSVTGEAFFKVSKDPEHPFVLNLGEIGLKVVGTSFNVMNYGDEDQIHIALKSGKVDLFKGKYRPDNQFIHLTPGQLLTYKKGSPEFQIKNVDIDKYSSWISGTLLFRDDPLSKVLKKLGRWYNISIEISDQDVFDFPVTATIKNENLDQIVDLLQYSTPFKYTISKSNGETKLIIGKK